MHLASLYDASQGRFVPSKTDDPFFSFFPLLFKVSGFFNRSLVPEPSKSEPMESEAIVLG
jgi:hypothetical protein